MANNTNKHKQILTQWGGGVLWYLGFEGLTFLGFGENIRDLGFHDLRLINFNILSEIHILLIYNTLDIG